MSQAERIGVFICDCGTNISETVNTVELSEFAGKQPDVVEVKIHRLWCSEEGRESMKKAITEKQLTRVVVAACSPKQHELTFQKVLSAANVNPFFLQMANIREQIAWVVKDKVKGTERARAQLAAALRRVMKHAPLEKRELECKKDFMVIGAGLSGMVAALTLAQKNRTVYLVEREPWIGGKIVAYEDIFPKLECAPCMLEPKMDEVMHDEQVVLLPNSSVVNIKGFFGNFDVEIQQKARFVDTEKCIGCGACYDVCPVTAKNKFNGNMSDRHAIFSAFAGVLPNAPAIDRELCLRFKGESCTKCQEACPLGAVDYEQKDRSVRAEVGAIVVATGFDVMDVSGMQHLSPGTPNVLNAYQFERIISSTGPTDGKVLTADGTPPKSIAFVHCVGSRDKNFKEYCSGVCCAYSLKLAHLAKKKMGGDVKIYGVYSDWCLPGKGYQEFYNSLASEGYEYVRVENPNDVQITPKDKELVINYGGGSIQADMVVLASAIVPAQGTADLAKQLGLSTDKYGFLSAEHERISPAGTTTRGIYVAGCATGPKDFPQSVLQAQAAAGMALSAIVPGEKIELEAATSQVDEKLCGGCRVCLSLCPYQAISFDEAKKASVINEVLCKGCGVCVSGCPAGAIVNKHFTNEQISSEIEGVLHE